MALLQRIALLCLCIALAISNAEGENRTVDGTGNNLTYTSQGASSEPLVRITYPSFYGDPTGETFIYEFINPRDISNTISSQGSSIPSKRGLSDLIWVWGQFLAHDMSLTTTSNGATNGEMPIPITSENDPLGPNPIPFVRSNFRLVDTNPPPTSKESWCEGCREQINENTSYIDASTVYGSTPARAAALRTSDGAGSAGTRLITGQNDLLPYNTMNLPNENVGRFSAEQLFAAGDIRSNENPLLAAMHTVFMREHNRLADIIEQQQPSLSDEETFQLARQIVGAEMQAITYNDYLPALMGEHAPAARDYSYDPTVNASITQSFSHAINRWGHSAISPQLQLVGDNGASLGHLALRDAFSDPTILSDDADKIDQLLRGAATQVSQEIDVHIVDDLRNFLFGPPGAGGLDLAALNIQRGRDHGLPGYVLLEVFYELEPKIDISQVTSDPDLATALAEVYNNDFVFADAWVLALAEDHLPETSVGELTMTVMAHQYMRLRDGDRLFYLSDDAGLFENGELKSEIKSIVDLENITLADIIRANTHTDLQDNAFFAAGLPSGDFDGDWQYSCSDLDALGYAIGSDDMRFDMNGDGQVTVADVMDHEYGWLKVGGAHNSEMTGGNLFYAGDANLDGVVDVTDLAIWQEHKFTSGTAYCSGDFNFDGRVDVSDFNIWNDHKSMRSSAASVPESSAMMLLVTAILPAFAWWPRRCRQRQQQRRPSPRVVSASRDRHQSRVSVASLLTGVITVADQDLAARWETVLRLFLRILGSFSILALIFVAVPYSWMNAIHAWLGMGQLPDEPIVGYLARSTSAFYALLGGLLWVVSFDLGRHHVVLVYLGATVTLFGAALLVVDWCEGLPLFWKLWEGPFVIAFGMAMLVLNRAIQLRADERA